MGPSSGSGLASEGREVFCAASAAAVALWGLSRRDEGAWKGDEGDEESDRETGRRVCRGAICESILKRWARMHPAQTKGVEAMARVVEGIGEKRWREGEERGRKGEMFLHCDAADTR